MTRVAGQRVAAVREALGPDVDIGVDIHAKFFEVSRAIRLARAIEPYHPMWLEEPIRPENVDAMAKLADHVNIPLASGECNYTKHEFRTILAAQALDIIQPDICVCGGLLEMKKIAAMAEAHYVMVAPHNPMGPVATVGQRALRRQHAELLDPGVSPRRRGAAQGPAQGAADGEGRLHPGARQSRASASS